MKEFLKKLKKSDMSQAASGATSYLRSKLREEGIMRNIFAPQESETVSGHDRMLLLAKLAEVPGDVKELRVYVYPKENIPGNGNGYNGALGYDEETQEFYVVQTEDMYTKKVAYPSGRLKYHSHLRWRFLDE